MTPSSLPTLLLALFLSSLGMGLIIPLLPMYAEELEASGFWIGFIFSAFSIAQAAMMPAIGLLSDKIGRKIFIATGLLLFASVSILFVLVKTPFQLALLRAGQGVAAAMIVPVAQAYAADISPVRREGIYMGLFSFTLFAGFGTGPLMGGLLTDMFTMDTGTYALVVMCLVAFVFVIAMLPNQLHASSPKRIAGKIFANLLHRKTVRGVVVFRLTTAMGRSAMVIFLPVFAHQRLHLSAGCIGFVMATHILLTALLQIPAGLLADRVNKNFIVITGGLLFSLFIVYIPFVKSFVSLLCLSICSAFLGALILPAVTALVVEHGRDIGMGATMSVFNASMSLGFAIGPLIAGGLVDSFGLDTTFYVVGMVTTTGVAYFAMNSAPYQRVKADRG